MLAFLGYFILGMVVLALLPLICHLIGAAIAVYAVVIAVIFIFGFLKLCFLCPGIGLFFLCIALLIVGLSYGLKKLGV